MIKDYYVQTSTFVPTQANPSEKNNKSKKPDCVIRAIATSMGVTWVDVYDELCKIGREMFDVPNSHFVYEEFFKRKGYGTESVKIERGKNRLNAEEFARRNKHGRFVLRLANHLTSVVDGKIRDTWNCGEKCIYKIYVISKN